MMNWYPFKNKASILWVGSRQNSIQEQRGLQVDYVDDLTAVSGIYDYIVLWDFQECSRSLLSYLKPDGRLLVVAENTYGIQNWCGKKETCTQIPFEGIDGYREQEAAGNVPAGRSVHRRQLEEILRAAGCTDMQFFYPMPDARDPRVIFSDEALPKTVDQTDTTWIMAEDLQNETSLLTDGSHAMKAVIENNVFPFFANYFVVDAGRLAGGFHLEEPLYIEKKEVKASSRKFSLSCMEENRRLLAYKGKAVTIGRRTGDEEILRQVHAVQMDLLKYLKEFCETHGLSLYLIYGTLLGAVRHGGLIPGDDDIDVALPREDYDELVRLGPQMPEPYFLQTPANDECFFGGYLKLRNRNTTAIDPQNWWVNCCEGISIDIFPLDYGYENHRKEWLKEKRICFYQRLLYAKAYGHFARFKDMPLLIWKAYKYFGKLFSRQALSDRLNRIMARGDRNENAPYGIFAHYGGERGKGKLRRKDFGDSIEFKYEGMYFRAPEGYEELLSKWYGDGYMYLPTGEIGRKRHAFYAPAVPCPNYIKRFHGLFRPALPGKKIVLFADDTLLPFYWKQYGGKYMPKQIVSVGGHGSGLRTDTKGIRIVELEQYQLSAGEMAQIYPVICTIYVRRAEEQLRKLGFRDYYIYMYNQRRDWLLCSDEEFALQEIRRELNGEI